MDEAMEQQLDEASDQQLAEGKEQLRKSTEKCHSAKVSLVVRVEILRPLARDGPALKSKNKESQHLLPYPSMGKIPTVHS